MDSKNSKTYVAVSSFSTCFPCKNMKMSYRIKKLKYQLQRGMINLNYLMDHIQYQIFKINLSTLPKNMNQ